jgi:copper chaperone
MQQQVFAVAGMTCGHCENAVRSELLLIPGVRTVRVDLQSGSVTVEAEAELTQADVQAAVREAGYELAR